MLSRQDRTFEELVFHEEQIQRYMEIFTSFLCSVELIEATIHGNFLVDLFSIGIIILTWEIKNFCVFFLVE